MNKRSDIMVIRMKNYEIDKFGEFLLSLPLKGKESRMRTRFIKILQERALVVQQEQMEVISEYVKKDEDGNPLRKKVDGREVWDVIEGKEKEFEQQMYEILSEDCIIEINAERKEMYEVVKNAVLNCDKEFSGQEAFEYDRFCEIVEDCVDDG